MTTPPEEWVEAADQAYGAYYQMNSNPETATEEPTPEGAMHAAITAALDKARESAPEIVGELRDRIEPRDRNVFSAAPDRPDQLCQKAADALALVSVGDGWRPIETAPTKGDHHILIWRPGMDFPNVATASMWFVGGFSAGLKPTHWRPLPPPPETR